ncbi:MAG TPA: hypothetical protein PLU64_14480, partial [Saprospiraceae bacterium]|nr:hypothetical protein [Saprospiraceae bacterium]
FDFQNNKAPNTPKKVLKFTQPPNAMKKKCPLYLLLMLSCFPVFSQSSGLIAISGKVVELVDGGQKGVPGVTVSVADQDYDITDKEGRFLLHLKSEKSEAIVALEGCPYPIVSPYGGKIFIPPSGELQIRVCGQENKKLRQQIDALEHKVEGLESQHKLSQRQLSKMHEALLDTILYYEAVIHSLSNTVEEYESSLQERQNRITALENKVNGLEQELFVALEKKYLRQKELYEAISGGLEEYTDQVKNLRDMLLPERISFYFLNEGAREQLYTTINNYNEARSFILNNHEGHVEAAAHYWAGPGISKQLNETYQYLLEDVHNEVVYPIEFSVNENLKLFLSRQLGRSRATAEARKGAEAAMSQLSPRIEILEKKCADMIQQLNTSL